MKFAFHMHAVRGHFRGRNPSDDEQAAVFDWVRREGFDGIDISDSWDFSALDEPSARRTRGLAEAHGLAIATVSCMGRTLCHPVLGEANLRALEHALQVASWLGGPIVNVSLAIPRTPGAVPVIGARHSPGGSVDASPADFDITAQRLRAVARLAAPRGIALSVELHDRGLADTSASLLSILNAVNEPNVGANPDLCNGYRAYDVPPESWQEALRALAPRTNLWHVNNVSRVHFAEIGRAVFVERTVGEGDVDYRWAMNVMRAARFDGWIVVEYKGSGDPFETVAKGRRYLAGLLARDGLRIGEG